MGFISSLGSLFDPGDASSAQVANQNINNLLTPDSPYWQAGQVNDAGPVVQGAAQLQNANIGVNTSALDADSSAYQALNNTFGNIASNGGALTQAALHQAQSNLANTGASGLRGAEQQQAANVLGQDQAERNWAASGATGSRAQMLKNQLQKQVWNMAVSHANFEAALAGKGMQNDVRNLTQKLGLGLTEGANAARNNQENTARQMQNTEFNNAMSAIQAIGGAVGQGASTISDISNAASNTGNGNALSGVSSGYTAGPTANFTDGYQQPAPALGSTYNQSKLATSSNYSNPITGDTVDPNLPTTTASWGDWLTNGSSLVS